MQHGRGLEPVEKADRAAGREHDVDGGQKPVGVIGRQRVHQDVVAAQLPHLRQRPGAGRQVAVGDQGSLGAAGGAGGVEQRGRGVVGDLRHRGHGPGRARQIGEGAPVAAQPLYPETLPPGFGEGLRLVRVADQQGRARVRQQRIHLPRRVGGVHGCRTAPSLKHAWARSTASTHFSTRTETPVALLHSASGQGGGCPVDGVPRPTRGKSGAARPQESRSAEFLAPYRAWMRLRLFMAFPIRKIFDRPICTL